MSHILNLEKHHLSDGGLAIVNRLGRSYSFIRTYDSFDRPPDLNQDLTKKEAYKMLENTLKQDVLEGSE
jgi:hypothetical protein